MKTKDRGASGPGSPDPPPQGGIPASGQGGASGPGSQDRLPQGGIPPSGQGGASGPGFQGRLPQGWIPPSGRRLRAPTLRPRCDASAPAVNRERPTDRCPACSLQLSWCGNCRGVAGPFDRFCGFCGFELIRGEPRSPLWRLGAIALVVLLAAGAGLGLWKAGVPGAVGSAVRNLSGQTPKAPVLTADHYSHSLAVRYSVPSGWTVVDYSAGGNPQS